MNIVSNYESPSAEIVEVKMENEFMSDGSVSGTIESGNLSDEEEW